MAEKDLNMVFAGSPTTVITQTADIADGVFSVASTNATHAELDNTSTPQPAGLATLDVSGWGTAPDANSTIDLYMIRQDVGAGTDDVTAPTTTDKKGAKFVGSFPIYDTDEAQAQEIVISLVGVKKAKFSILNNAGQLIDFSDGAATVKIERFTYKPEPAA